MSMMTLKRFEKYCSIYGSNFHLWPECEAEVLRDFMADEPRALDLYLKAQALDTQLDDFDVPAANPDVILAAKAQIAREQAMEQAANDSPSYKIRFSGGAWWNSRPAYAFATALCFIIVLFLANKPSFERAEYEQSSVEIASIDDALDDIAALADAAEAREDVLAVFAEVEQERRVEQFIDSLAYEYDDTITNDVWNYFDQQG